MSDHRQGIGYIDNLQALDDANIKEKIVMESLVNFTLHHDRGIFEFFFDMETVNMLMISKDMLCPRLIED